jgi:hypothetical protein
VSSVILREKTRNELHHKGGPSSKWTRSPDWGRGSGPIVKWEGKEREIKHIRIQRYKKEVHLSFVSPGGGSLKSKKLLMLVE